MLFTAKVSSANTRLPVLSPHAGSMSSLGSAQELPLMNLNTICPVLSTLTVWSVS